MRREISQSCGSSFQGASPLPAKFSDDHRPPKTKGFANLGPANAPAYDWRG